MQLPNHTQLSNEIIDHYMADLSGSEFKCLVAIARKTIGWHKEVDSISLSQLEELTGLVRQTVVNATESLEESEIINVDRSNNINKYDINYGSLKNRLVQKLDQEQSKNHTSDSLKIRHTKDTTTKETKQKKEISVASKLDDPFPNSCEYLSDAEELANLLLDKICYWDPQHAYNKKSKPNKSWILEIERAMRIDGRTKEQLEYLIEYIFTQSTDVATFWAPNIQSGKKLRSKFDKIKNQIKKEHNHGKITEIRSTVDSLHFG